MESGAGVQPVAAQFASSSARGEWPWPRGTAVSLGEEARFAHSPGGQSGHVVKSVTLVQQGGMVVCAVWGQCNIMCTSASLECNSSKQSSLKVLTVGVLRPPHIRLV